MLIFWCLVMMVVVVLNRPSTLLRGVLRNALLEPQSNVFVGNLDAKRIKALVALLLNEDAVLCVQSPKSPQGLRLKIFGEMPNREIVEIDGLQFVQRKSVEKSIV